MSLRFEKLENKIALSSFGYHKPNLVKITQQANIVQQTNNVDNQFPLFVMSITPNGAIHCEAKFGKVILRG
jgi:hypothetical protein